MRSVCAWCQKVLSGSGEDITHTICDECKVKLEQELDAYNYKKANWYGVYKTSSKSISNNQLTNMVVVQILFMVTGRPYNYSKIADALTLLKDSGEEKIGQKIMDRMIESLDDEKTIWNLKSTEEKEEIKVKFRKELLNLMKMVSGQLTSKVMSSESES